MGPLATVDFMRKLIEETPADRDEDHVPVIVYSVPQIPPRPAFIFENGETPLPAMLKGIDTLVSSGATLIAIPCNTAYYWYENFTSAARRIPIVHIADAACDAMQRLGVTEGTVGLMGTRVTLATGFYQSRLNARGYRCITNCESDLNTLVLPGIEKVKQFRLAEAADLLVLAARRLIEAGAQKIILGCTEIPVALDHSNTDLAPRSIDATRTLAQACVYWWLQNREPGVYQRKLADV
jgi:aspartate racemase